MLQIDYRNLKGEDSSRMVEPRSLFVEGDSWYLNAFDQQSSAPRNFRVDQIKDARVVKVAKRSVDGRTPSNGVQCKSRRTPPPLKLDIDQLPYTCRVKFKCSVAFHASQWPGASLRPSRDGVIEADISYADPAWVAHKVMALHGQAEVVFPEDVRETVRAAAMAALENL